MKVEIIGNPGTEWTDNPRSLTKDEVNQIKALGYLDGVKMHRKLTKSTLSVAATIVRAIQK